MIGDIRGIRWAIVLAIGLILAAIVHGGVYELSSPGTFGGSALGLPVVARLNKFTGNVAICMMRIGPTATCQEASWDSKQ